MEPSAIGPLISVVIATIGGVVVAYFGYRGVKISRARRGPHPLLPSAVPLTPEQTAAVRQYENLERQMNINQKNFDDYRIAIEASDRQFRTQISTERQEMNREIYDLRLNADYAFNWLQVVEEDFTVHQQFTLSIMEGVSNKVMPPFPSIPTRRHRPPRTAR